MEFNGEGIWSGFGRVLRHLRPSGHTIQTSEDYTSLPGSGWFLDLLHRFSKRNIAFNTGKVDQISRGYRFGGSSGS